MGPFVKQIDALGGKYVGFVGKSAVGLLLGTQL